MSNIPNRPVDMSDDFKENGWEYCKYWVFVQEEALRVYLLLVQLAHEVEV